MNKKRMNLTLVSDGPRDGSGWSGGFIEHAKYPHQLSGGQRQRAMRDLRPNRESC
jgi:ABC-type glutathione transport system ATPase component